MGFLIIPLEESDFRIDESVLAQQLRVRWPAIEFETITLPNVNSTLRWHLNLGSGRMLGVLHENRRTIALEGSEAEVVEFAIWYRSIVSSRHQLFLHHDSTPEGIEIKETDTPEILVNQMENYW